MLWNNARSFVRVFRDQGQVCFDREICHIDVCYVQVEQDTYVCVCVCVPMCEHVCTYVYVCTCACVYPWVCVRARALT